MSTNHKVSVARQIVFTFISILNLWAFNRIRKLQKYLLYVIAPQIVITIILTLMLSAANENLRNAANNYRGSQYLAGEAIWGISLFFSYYLIGTLLSASIFQALSICLVIKWSREHNRAFENSVNKI
jgi:hypothetical protein